MKERQKVCKVLRNWSLGNVDVSEDGPYEKGSAPGTLHERVKEVQIRVRGGIVGYLLSSDGGSGRGKKRNRKHSER